MKEELKKWRKRAETLQAELDRHDRGTAQLHMAADALLCQVALRFGETVTDEDTGEHLGWRLTLPAYDPESLAKEYEVHARKDGASYVVGVVRREEQG